MEQSFDENKDIISDITDNLKAARDVLHMIRNLEEMKIKRLADAMPEIMQGVNMLGELNARDTDSKI